MYSLTQFGTALTSNFGPLFNLYRAFFRGAFSIVVKRDWMTGKLDLGSLATLSLSLGLSSINCEVLSEGFQN